MDKLSTDNISDLVIKAAALLVENRNRMSVHVWERMGITDNGAWVIRVVGVNIAWTESRGAASHFLSAVFLAASHYMR